ncbi:NACHT domain-containing NTPase [Myxococcus sp. CA039A]|uniref:NACHT domain-containing protein n=1 Tax=Myxococcus sp. CA039A TaxID=2741737 RepID=UPI00157B435F|nr:NACHT domain-containing protein [Myxococcus sp. CA039A]NTX58207.1 NACHT domain-containing protein [Myxococcus sp. CA039A]
MTSIAIGLFARALIKSGGEAILSAGAPFIASFKKELIGGVSGEAPAAIRNTIERLNIKKSTRDRLLSSGSIFDLAGLAWSELLSELPDDIVSINTSMTTARELARRLDPYWFVEAITSPRASEVAFDIGAKSPAELFEEGLNNKAVALICNEVRDELQLEEDVDPRPLVEAIIRKMPNRIHELWISIPGIEARVTRLNSEAILKHVDGSIDKAQLNRELWTISQQLIATLDEDVFGRQSAQRNEPPLLMHRSTYVEPEATMRRARVKDSSGLARGPVKDVIRRALASESKAHLVMLHAPFGYGKSLTFKSLAADLAGEWQKAPAEAPFPILLKCPEILSGHVSTLKAAVQNSLSKQTTLAPSAIEKLWTTQKLVLLLDSFDEVHMAEKEARGWIDEMRQISNGERVRVVVASRPHAFSEKWLSTNDWEIELQRFDEARGQQWLDAVAGLFGPKSLTFKEVSATLDPELAGTPILLVMAAYGWDETAALRKISKASLYRRFIEKISTGKWSDVQEAHQVVLHGMDVLAELAGPNAFRKALRILAWEYLRMEQRYSDEKEVAGLSRRHVSDTLQSGFNGIGEEQIDTITHSLCLSLFLHKSAGTESVVFTHRSFREYLCAEHVVDTLRSRRSGLRYLSPAWQLMTEAELGEADLAFAGELLQELDGAERAQVVGALDDWYRDGRRIFHKGKNELQIEKGELDSEFGLAPPGTDRFSVFHANVERLSLVGRNISLREMSERLRIPFSHLGTRDVRTLSDGECRILTVIMHKAEGIDSSYGYRVEDGAGVLVHPIQELDFYRECLEKAPAIMVPVVDVGRTYFICQSPGLRIHHFVRGGLAVGARYFLDYGRTLEQAEIAGLQVSPYGLSRAVWTSGGFKIGFIFSEDVRFKMWWAFRGLTMAIESLSDISDSHGLAPSSDEMRKVHEIAGTLLSWNELPWRQLFTAYESLTEMIEHIGRRALELEGVDNDIPF